MTTDLESRIRQLEDRAQIGEQVIKYAMGVDRRDWAMFASCFTDPVYADFAGGGIPAATKITTLGQRTSSWPRSAAALTTCSRLSRMSSHRSSPSRSATASNGDPAWSAPTARPMADSTNPGSVTAASATNTVFPPNRRRSRSPHRHRQPGLADPARAGQRHQPHLGPGQQAGHFADGLIPPDQRGRAGRQ